jgi:hypothetical protein
MKCRGFFIPQYKTMKETFYLPDKDATIAREGRFETVDVFREIESVCADCKQCNCKGEYGSSRTRQEEIDL